MYLHVFIITFAAWISFSLAAQDAGVESNFDLHGTCSKKNYGRRKVIKGNNGKEKLIICLTNNDGVYSWKKAVVETGNDVTDYVMEDIMLKRIEAMELEHQLEGLLEHQLEDTSEHSGNSASGQASGEASGMSTSYSGSGGV